MIVGTVLLQSCGGVGGPASPSTSSGSSAPTQAFLALLTPEQKASKTIGPVACAAANCHGGPTTSKHVAGHLTSLTASGDTGQYDTWKNTVHASKGVTCESCHGPGGAHQAMPTNTDGTPHAILTFPLIASATVCGQCHGPLHDDWAGSKHAQVISTPVTEAASAEQSSQCFVCHGGLVRAQYLENGIPPEQMTLAQITTVGLNTWVPGTTSNPAGSPGPIPNTATCSTCHNPHAKMGNVSSATGKDVQIYHSEALTDSSGIVAGTTVQQYSRINQVCAQCHNGRATDGSDAALLKSTSRSSAHHSNQFNSLLGVGGNETPGGPPQRSGTHALAPGQCANCHMPASRHTYTVSYEGCAPCHTVTDAAARASALQTEIVDDLTALNTEMSNWATTTFGAADGWDFSSNQSPNLNNQAKIPLAILRARHNYYYEVISGDYGVHNPAYTRYLMQWAETNLQTLGLPKANMDEIKKMPMSTKLSMLKAARQRTAKANSPY
ncbi:MAG: ammonia-forming cytochrome c nitrite reductase subunit c552 [Fimbriimonas sp.]|nr:ammonia-forming cytochrome c nitrite reductase subunit c552 [Fimbriimonas sp.]